MKRPDNSELQEMTAHVVVRQNIGRQPDEITGHLQPQLLSFQRLAGYQYHTENIASV